MAAPDPADRMRRQYERYPYPPRDPADEAKRLITGSPSHLVELNHYLFGGARDFAEPFRALIAGGGTGDATIMLARQLAALGGPHEIVHLDISESSSRIARRRAAARGLDRIRFVAGSLLDLPAPGLSGFDYIDCCGVLHHLDDPLAGLERLRDALADAGGMGLMLYAPLGRTGIYPVQDMLRALVPDEAPEAQVAFARRFLDRLPPTNWLRRNPLVKDHRIHGDAGLYDLFLHSRDRAFYVEEAAALVADAGLHLVAFAPPLAYDPALYLDDGELLRRLAAKSRLENCAFAERLTGQMSRHVFYVSRRGGDTTAGPPAARSVPAFRDGGPLPGGPAPGAPPTVELAFGGVEGRFPLPDGADRILAEVDGRRSLAEIHARLTAGEGGGGSAFDRFLADYGDVHRILNGAGQLFFWQSPQPPPAIAERLSQPGETG